MDHMIILEALAQPKKVLSVSINTVWSLLSAVLVFFMQAGFPLVEAGSPSPKNTLNILTKIILSG